VGIYPAVSVIHPWNNRAQHYWSGDWPGKMLLLVSHDNFMKARCLLLLKATKSQMVCHSKTQVYVTPIAQTNPSPKQSFWKALFNRGEFENAGFQLECERKTC